MIDDLDKTLKALLQKESPNLFGDQDGEEGAVGISFAIPDDKFAASMEGPTIDLFLYDVRENLELRAGERMVVERQNTTTATQKRPPVQADFSYMITAWSSETGDPNSAALSEHQLLSAVMQILLRYPAIPPEVLQGSLHELEPLPRAIVLQPIRLQSMGEFWQALGGKPKAVINYTVTVSVDAYKPVEVKLAQEREIRYKRIDTLN